MSRPGIRLAVAFAALSFGIAAAGASAAAGPTLAASTARLSFGSSLTLRGTASSAAAGQDVQLLSQACGFTAPVAIAKAKAGPDGAYAFNLQPALNTVFTVQVGDTQSNATSVAVTPVVSLRRTGARTYQVHVSVGAGQFFSKAAVLQRYDQKRKRWLRVASANLAQASDVGALIAVSSATIHAKVAHGTKIRASVPQATLGQCYRAASSAPIGA